MVCNQLPYVTKVEMQNQFANFLKTSYDFVSDLTLIGKNSFVGLFIVIISTNEKDII